ncbi:hypothetical protein C8A05DRAFT_36633 [Staphylotrichum tortipilum]|uniref:CHAT domain-containing protein n=1 Tax=Staphylotrichum tortipilum TaxID=2831512 RepID=A0AAN6MGY3_9PEZI|nr:hypothetical protein C8A05DRAFT_36633 [Staphylotrichum longicolle]
MPVVSIVDLGQQADPSAAADGTSRKSNRIFLVTNHTADHGSQHQWLEIPSMPLELMDEVRWYLEKFAVDSPLETKRADRVKKALKNVGRALVSSIDWASILGPQGRDDTLIISVQEQPRGFEPVVWELLEDPELWDEPFKGGVFVTRHVPKPAKAPTEATGSASLNILIVAARHGEEQDIPHRIVSKILHNKIRRQAGQLALPSSLKILRPPTWNEFNRELEAKGPGFYDIIHFDLHGEKMGDNRQGLAFVDVTQGKNRKDPGKFNLVKRMVSASDLASVLARYRVRRVVLNACRSAHYQDADDSIALGILKAGVEECVAMTFDVVSRAIEIFMSIFYDAILIKGLALDAAAAWARQALRLKPDRQSRYATSIPVYDYVVPVCYTHAFPRSSDAYRFKGRSLQFPRQPPFGDVVGREGDILSLETQLLASKKWLWLCGRPGVGKSALLRHVSTWWQETGLFTGFYLHDCRAATPQWDVEGFWRGVHDRLLPIAEYHGTDAVVEYLRQNNCLLILDNLPASVERTYTLFIAQILKKLNPRSTKVILAARSDKGWESLNDYFEPRREHLAGLGKIGSLQLLRTYMNKAIQDATEGAVNALGESSEDLHCFEQLALLLAGNPAAFRVVVAAFLYGKASTMKEFLTFLILGEPLMDTTATEQHLMTISHTEDIHCVEELLRIIQSLEVPPTGKYSVPVTILAPFWDLLPRSDLPVFLGAYSYQVNKDLPDDFRAAILAGLMGQEQTEIPGSSTLSPEVQSAVAALVDHPDSFAKSPELREKLAELRSNPPPPKPTGDERLQFLVKDGPDYADYLRGQPPVFNLFVAACARIVEPLEAAHFLSVSTKKPLGHSKTDYYSIHPLLPLLLRTSPVYHFYGTKCPGGIEMVHVKEAFIFYYAYRARTWPIERQYFEPQWRTVREELGLEFFNFVTAIAMHGDISKDLPNITMKNLLVSPMASVLHRGIGTEVSRFQLVHIAQEKALEFVLSQEKRVSASVGATPDPEKLQILMILRMHGAAIAGTRRAFAGAPTSEENKPFAALSWSLYQRMKQMGDDFVEDTFAKLDVTPASFRYLDRCYEVMADPTRASPEAMFNNETWKLRQDFMRESAATTGDTLYTTHKTWEDVPQHAITGGKLKLELLSTIEQANDAMARGQFGQAREIVDTAWKREVLKRNDDRHHKARLLELRAAICDRDGDRESGAEHRREATRLLEAPLGPRGSNMPALGPQVRQALVEGFFEGFMGDRVRVELPLRGPWASIYVWQLLTTPMDASELWVAIFLWQVTTAPSQEPWMAIFFWRPMASPWTNPGLWVSVAFWLVMEAVISWFNRSMEIDS